MPSEQELKQAARKNQEQNLRKAYLDSSQIFPLVAGSPAARTIDKPAGRSLLGWKCVAQELRIGTRVKALGEAC